MPAVKDYETPLSLGWSQPAPRQREQMRRPTPQPSSLPKESSAEDLELQPLPAQHNFSSWHPLPATQPALEQGQQFYEPRVRDAMKAFARTNIGSSRLQNLSHYSSGLNLTTRPELSASQLRDLRKQFELRDETNVRSYLREYPFLFPLLLEAKAQVTRIFGEETRTALQVSVDPTDWSAQLFIVIPTRHGAKAALALLDQLDQEWWLEVSERADFRMNFIPEFV